jgi:two-component system alkaline phosphatase synthesis response regulator PhoP
MTGAGKRVLLAEDDRFLRRACEASLSQRGITVLSAIDGAAALELARAERVDLILLDMLMPRMNGLDVLRSLRADERTRDVPVLVLSNSSREEDIALVRQLGVLGYLVKANLSLRELADRVTAILDGNAPDERP